MTTVSELITLQGKPINEAKPLNPVRQQYSQNSNVDTNKLLRNIDLLTQQMNNLNSGVKNSSFNLNKAFSLATWVSQVVVDITKAKLANSLGTTVSTDQQSNQYGVTNSTPITSKILKSANTVLLNIITLQQQIDIQILTLEDQVNSVISKINTNTTMQLEDGTIVQIPVADQQTLAALLNIENLAKSLKEKTEKVTIRISNDKPITNINDFVNNLSLKHIVEFSQLLISALILIKQIQISKRKIQSTAVLIETTIAASAYPNTGILLNDIVNNMENDVNELNDLNKAYEQINILKDNIIFFGKINTQQQQSLNNIINKVDSFIVQQQNNNILQDLKSKLTPSL